MPTLGEILFFCICVLALIAAVQRIYGVISRFPRLRFGDKIKAFLREGKGVLRSAGLSADDDEGDGGGTTEKNAAPTGREGPPTDGPKGS
jgi:hypothetical protein